MAIQKLKRGVLPLKSRQKHIQSTVYISPSTPLPAALKRVDKYLVKTKVRVLGLGRAIQVVLQVAAALRTRKYKVELRTVTMTAIDERIDEFKGESKMEQRPVPAIELIVAR